MKKIKKVLALLVAMVMVMGMTMTTMAAPAGTIKVNTPEGVNVKYAQIVEEDRESVYGWKFVDSVKNDFVKAFLNENVIEAGDADKVIAALIDEGKLEKITNKNIENSLTTDNADYSRALEAVRVAATNPAKNGEFTPGAIGLYLITAEKEGYTFVPMAAYVGTEFNGLEVEAKGSEDQIKKEVGEDGQSVSKGDLVSYTVTVEYPYYPANATSRKFIVAKGSEDQIKKEVGEDGQSVSKGDLVSYTVTVEYPYYPANATSRKFIVKDTLTNATFEEATMDLHVKVDDKELSNEKYTASVNENKTTLTIDFGKTYDANLAGKTVTITYKATVGDVTSENHLKNTVTSETEKGFTTDEIESDTVKVKVIKEDEKDTNIKLQDAEFTLYVADVKGTEEITYSGEKIKVNVVGTKVTNAEGKAIFDGLDAQKRYYVKETKAPEGYSLNETVYKLEGATLVGQTEYDFTDFTDIHVPDTKLSSLPSTGGIGTTIFTIGGCVIMIAAAGLFFASRKKENK